MFEVLTFTTTDSFIRIVGYEVIFRLLFQTGKIEKVKCALTEMGQTLNNDIYRVYFTKKFSLQGATNLNFSVKLRTYQKEGTVMFHKMSSTGYMKMFLQVSSLLDTAYLMVNISRLS